MAKIMFGIFAALGIGFWLGTLLAKYIYEAQDVSELPDYQEPLFDFESFEGEKVQK